MAGSKRSHEIAHGENPAVPQKKPIATPSWTNNKMVTIVVNSKAEFNVHSDHLMAKIPHFKKHFGPDAQFKEGADGRCFVPIDREVFENIMDWIYRDTLPPIPTLITAPATKKTLARQVWDSRSAKVEEIYHKIIIEAEAWMCRPLAGAALDAIRTAHYATGEGLSLGMVYKGVKFVFEKTEYARFLKLYIITDIMENGRQAHSRHMKASLELEGGKSAFMEDLIWLCVQQSQQPAKDRPTLSALMDIAKVPVYKTDLEEVNQT